MHQLSRCALRLALMLLNCLALVVLDFFITNGPGVVIQYYHALTL